MLSCCRSLTLGCWDEDEDRCWDPLSKMSQLTQLYVSGGSSNKAPVLTTLHKLRDLTYNLALEDDASLLISSTAELTGLILPIMRVSPYHDYVCNTATRGLPFNVWRLDGSPDF